MDKERRFSGTLSDDYPAWKEARRHVADFYAQIGGLLASVEAQGGSTKIDVLEIGCGDGNLTRVLLDTRDDLALTAIDGEPKMLAGARERLAEALDGGRVSLAESDALAFVEATDDASYDAIVSSFVYHNMEDGYRGDLFREIHRVLRPGGWFVNADKYAQAGTAHTEAVHWQIGRFFDTLLPAGKTDLLRDWVLHYFDDEAEGRILKERDAARLLESIGFEQVETLHRFHMDALVVARRT